MQNLPVGYSSLQSIRDYGCIYVDKTKFIYQLIAEGKYYFLSRPRRFGKSLLVDTIKQLFLGNSELFEGLFVYNNWDWNSSYPVIHIDFSIGDNLTKPILEEKILNTLDNYANSYQINLTSISISERFYELIYKLYEKERKQVVILIDEYDKPMLDVLTKSELCQEMRAILRSLYSVIKGCDEYIRFAFITGVSKFSKVSVFSGLNNIEDISLNHKYADICGYTQHDIEHVFDEYILDGKVDLDQLRIWYNGYNFNGVDSQKVYNPFDIMLFFKNNYTYDVYWFETGSPKFLLDVIQHQQYYIPNLENVILSKLDLNKFDIDNMDIISLLYQTGYLTIKNMVKLGVNIGYRLSYPNLEVKSSFTHILLDLGVSSLSYKNALYSRFANILSSNNYDDLGSIIASHFASIPHDWYRHNEMGRFEGFYCSIVYSYFCALGYDVIAEDKTNYGSIDIAIRMPDRLILMEFKLHKYGDALSAINQIKTKGYIDKYIGYNLPIYLIGISFDSEAKNVAECIWQLV
jgi:hypothetical protein